MPRLTPRFFFWQHAFCSVAKPSTEIRMIGDAAINLNRPKVSRRTHAAQYSLLLLLTICFCLATDLTAWFQNWRGNRAESANLMAVAMGDARRLFANHFFVKADAYF